jgi:hypothetical protein
MEDNGYGFHKDSGEAVTKREAKDMFNEMLDECYEEIRFGELSYLPSDVLESTDPIAHRCGVNDYIDSLCQDGDTIVYSYEDTDAYAEESEEDD